MEAALHDLVIIGGGLVGMGTALALALQNQDLQIALVDASLPLAQDARLFALNQGSIHFLKQLGLWPDLSAHASPIHEVHVSYQKHFGSVRFNRKELGLPALGYVIPAKVIEAAFSTRLNKLASAHHRFTLYRPATLRFLKEDTNGVNVVIEALAKTILLQASRVIGADGSDSIVRGELGIETVVKDYQQSAIVTQTQLSRAHGYIAYERFHAQGAIAMLPLIGRDDAPHQCATIWTADNATTSQLMMLSDEAFLQTLQREFGYRLGRLLAIHPRYQFPLRQIRARDNATERVMLLGNAAHTLHPIAAQGLNLALYEVAILVDGIKQKLDLQAISRRMRKQQTVGIGLSHHLSYLFSSERSFARALLSLGMMGLNHMLPIKKRVIRELLGKSREPRLFLSL